MVPTAAKTILGTVTVEDVARRPSRTYRIDLEHGRVQGMTDGREAMAQAIRKVLDTQRFSYLIYSWNYGMEWNGLLGKSRAVVESEGKRLLWETLRQDERVTALGEVSITWTGRQSCHLQLEVETIFGTIREEVLVNV